MPRRFDQSIAPSAHAAGRLRTRLRVPTATPRPSGVAEASRCRDRAGRHSMLIDDYRRRVAATVIQLAQDDPILVREVIGRLRAAGEIEADDLVYLDRIAERWIAIAAGNRRRQATAARQELVGP